MINNVTTFRPKKKTTGKVGSILTWTSPEFGSISEQFASAIAMLKVSPKVYVMSEVEPPRENGLFWVKTASNKLKVMLGYYMARVPGRETVIIANPTVEIGGRLPELLEFVESSRMGLAWAGFSRAPNDPNGPPKLFILSSGTIPFLMQQINDNLTLEGQHWANVTHDILGKLMMRPRYVDANPFGLIASSPEPIANAYELEPPVKKKPGRPKKTTA